MKRFNFPAYTASFRQGVRLCLHDRADLISMVLIYAMLMTVFCAIYTVMPVHELGRPDISRMHLLWYFAITELVVVSVQGNERELGRLIAEGQLTVMMQRPGSMMLIQLTRNFGTVCGNFCVLAIFSLVFVRLISGMESPMALAHVPLFLLSAVMGIGIFLLMGYCVGMLEIFGPYSRSFGWMMNKTIFTFGGLFFPVMFFPQVLQNIVRLTPFPAVISAPASFMLHPGPHDIAFNLLSQMVWLVLLSGLAIFFQNKLTRRVLMQGD